MLENRGLAAGITGWEGPREIKGRPGEEKQGWKKRGKLGEEKQVGNEEIEKES